MPLHEWATVPGWEGMRLLWMTEVLRYLKVRLPSGFRAYFGSGPALAVGAPPVKPDLSVRAHAGDASVPALPAAAATTTV